jgi:type IV secretion system T-DNA border endonuclease VirD2
MDFRRSRLVKGRSVHVSLPLAERLRAARRIPQAVVKITSFAHGAKKVRELMQYISRDGKLELESEGGEAINNLDQQRELVARWSKDFDKEPRSRDAAHIVFSMPRGSDPEALRRSVRTVISRHFARHQAVWGIHTDRDHPHAHVILVMRERQKGHKLEFKKPDLYRLREVFAEAAREQGVEMAVSPRAARGVGRKSRKRASYRMKQRGLVPRAEKETAREIMDSVQKGDLLEKPWEAAMRRRHALERQAYHQEAERLRLAAQSNPKDREAILKAVADLEQFAKSLPVPKTLRQSLLERLGASTHQKPEISSEKHEIDHDR